MAFFSRSCLPRRDEAEFNFRSVVTKQFKNKSKHETKLVDGVPQIRSKNIDEMLQRSLVHKKGFPRRTPSAWHSAQGRRRKVRSGAVAVTALECFRCSRFVFWRRRGPLGRSMPSIESGSDCPPIRVIRREKFGKTPARLRSLLRRRSA
jgi:hypothetical protein